MSIFQGHGHPIAVWANMGDTILTMPTHPHQQTPPDEIHPLHALEATYRSVFENTGTATVIVEADMTIIMANAKFEALCGYRRDEIEGRKQWPEFVHPDYVDRMKGFHLARRSGQGRPPTEYTCRVVRRDGAIRDIQMKVGMIPGSRQSILSFMDITARKEAEQALLQSSRQIRDIVDMIDGFVYTCSADYRMTFMNKRLIEHTGYDGTGRLCHQVMHGLDNPCPFCVNERVFAGQAVNREIRGPRDGRWYYAMNTPVHEDGRVVKKQAVIIDITERKAAEEKLQKEVTLLKHSLRNRSRFGRIIGQCAPMQEVYRSILQAAATDSPVIIYGGVRHRQGTRGPRHS